jgi:signal transduction histidine kinase
MKSIIKEKGLSVGTNQQTLGALPLVWGDPDRVKQILYNMVGNAVKFAPDKNGVVEIDAVAAENQIKVTIKDNGRGISDENKKFLFHKLQQAGDSILTRDTSRGTGLGLYISKIMSEAMGGQVALEATELGKGSTFSFTLPIATDKQRAAQPTSTDATDSTTGLTTTDPTHKH